MTQVREVESAIAPHLRNEAAGTGGGERPQYDSYTSRLDPNVTKVVIAYFGSQCRDAATRAAVSDLQTIVVGLTHPNGPKHHELSAYVDEAGCGTALVAGYWLDPADFDKWYSEVGMSWTAGSSANGRFVEIVRPSVRRLETLHSSDEHLQGLATLAVGPSGPIAEHGYWGGMRDRIPDSRRSDLAGAGLPKLVADVVVTVEPQDQMCLIRSGQDFSSTVGAERDFYVDKVEPQLRAGMEFLRDAGTSIGCYANRYVTVLDESGALTEKSYGMSWWRDIADLEMWAKSHPTHLRIFGAFNRHMNEFGADAQLRLYHEVLVVPAEDQFFQYSNCHADTGLLRVQRIR